MSQIGEGGRSEPDRLDWSVLFKRLVTWTRRHHHLSREDAKEIAQEAILRFLDPDYARYDPAEHGTVLWFLGSIVNGIVVNEHRRSASAKWFFALANDPEALSPEARAIALEHADLVVTRLLQRTKRDPVVHRLLLAMLAGIDGTDEMAKAIGVAPGDMDKIRKRLRGHLEAVMKTLRKIDSLELLRRILRFDDDLLDPNYPEALIDEELREAGADPDKIGRAGEAFVKKLAAERGRKSSGTRLRSRPNAPSSRPPTKPASSLPPMRAKLDTGPQDDRE